MNNLVIIAGPTAAGKTALSIELCKRIKGEVISADSMQVYKGMDIGSAKILPEEMNNIIHHGIDILDPKDDYNVALFQNMAHKAMESSYKQGHIPVIVGGTGFYIQSVLYDISFTETNKDTSYREYLEDIVKTKGPLHIHNMLNEIDPESASVIHYNNTKRVIRALEYFKETGQKISEHNNEQKAKESPYNYAFFVITDNRDSLYTRINKRVDKMINDGLVDEVTRLKEQGLNNSYVSMQGLGYKEIIDYLDGKCTLDEAIDRIKMETRRFAKRQITWFKREKEAIWIDRSLYDSEDKMLEYMLKTLKERDIYHD